MCSIGEEPKPCLIATILFLKYSAKLSGRVLVPLTVGKDICLDFPRSVDIVWNSCLQVFEPETRDE